MTAGLTEPMFDAIAADCAARGMNLVGAVDAQEFDATQPCGRRVRERAPACGVVVVLGSGGRAAWDAVTRERGAAPAGPRAGHHPIDAWSRRVAATVTARLARAGHAARVVGPDERRALNFRQLGEAAGLGVISPVIGHLLHPEFGPWISVRAALLVDGMPFGARLATATDGFEPCCGCAQPCRRACPAAVYAACGTPDLDACATHRLADGCTTGCDVLRACPLGSAHRYGAEEEAFRHAYAMFRIRRWKGVGRWRYVPEFVRRRL